VDQHIVLLPLVVVALVGLHVLMVRLRGVVPPFAAKGETPGGDAAVVSTSGAEVQA
jgi:quinol-cytochrome oxidoreductase complex cytochrome b subunit